MSPNPECPHCGFRIDSASRSVCPKCDQPLRARTNGRILVVDVAHAGEDRDEAVRKLERAVDEAIRGNFRGLKVIHGHGSVSGHGLLKPVVVAAMKRSARECGGTVAPDRGNPGASLLWLE